jgi:hypothetical protein
MACENRFSMFLLLCLIALIIYIIWNSKEHFQEITSSSNPVQTEEETVVEEEPVTSSEQPTMVSQPPTMVTQPPTMVTQPPTMVTQPPTMVTEPPMVSQPPSVVSEPPKQETTDIFNFNASDDSTFNDFGSSLGDAFAPPVPPGTNTDQVDFKLSNVDNFDVKTFLPKEVNDEWFETDFSLAKYQLNDDKLINTDRYIIGINTVGQSLKNASYDIRGTIPNPKTIVSPWNNSTIEPDFNLKPLC